MKASEVAYALFFFIVLGVVYLTVIHDWGIGETMEGKGKIISREMPVAPFEKISADGVCNIYLQQGDKESVVVETHENLLNLVRTEVVENTLKVGWKRHINLRKAKIDIYVTIRDANEIRLSGVVNFQTPHRINLERIRLEINSVGNTEMNLNCKQLEAKASSTGDVTLRGQAELVRIENSGVSDVNAFDLVAGKMAVDNSGVGDVKVNARHEIRIRATGVGDVSYKGTAVVKEISKSGVGDVVKM